MQRGAKTQAIRDELATGASATEVVANLKKRRIKTTLNTVYNIKATMKNGHTPRRAAALTDRESQLHPVNGLAVKDLPDFIRRVKGVAKEMGGIGRLRDLISALEE